MLKSNAPDKTVSILFLTFIEYPPIWGMRTASCRVSNARRPGKHESASPPLIDIVNMLAGFDFVAQMSYVCKERNNHGRHSICPRTY